MRQYNYTMGIRVGNVDLPDPAEWTYQVGDLDTSGSRDANGLLHRSWVATKINYEFKWNGLEWKMLDTILSAVKKAKFKRTAPDPRSFKETYTGNYYVGDRSGKNYYYLTNKEDVATFDLKLKFIEY